MSPYSVNILGVRINSTSLDRVLKQITDIEAKSGQNGHKLQKPLIIFTPNPEFLVAADKDEKFRKLLNSSDINLPDGIGLVLAGKILGRPIKERVSGADLVEKLLAMGNENKWEVGIVGARRGIPGESEELIKRLLTRYPQISFINLDTLKYKIEITNYNLILACHGMKKQEEWIAGNQKQFKALVMIGVGGSLDFLAGYRQRAPGLLRKMGLEWLWRGLEKPAHWRRVYTAVFEFGWRLLKSFFGLDPQKP